MKKILSINLIILLFSTCDEPENIICYEGTQLDECGVCCGGNSNVECSSEAGTGVMDSCGVCFGDNTECQGCTDPDAINYDSNATISNGECTYDPSFWNLDLQFLTEEFYCISSDPILNTQCNIYLSENTCNEFYEDFGCYWIATHEGKIGNPIYWLNSSNTDIFINYTEDTTISSCIETLESIINDIDCSEYNTDLECTNSTCEWEVSLTYNPDWDNFTLLVPQQTTTNIIQYIFLGFNYPTEETYCAEINNEIKCGKIRITN